MIATSESIKSISAALLAFQGHVTGVNKDAQNPHFKSRYASLENVIDTARPALQSVGIMFMQAPGTIVEGALEVTTLLVHAESGEWMRSTIQMPLAKRDPQGTGSAQTYAQRYSLMALLGLPPTDDDAESTIYQAPRGTPNTVTGKPASSAALKRNGEWDEFQRDLAQCETVGQVKGLYKVVKSSGRWTDKWLDEANEAGLQRIKEIEANTPDEPEPEFPGDRPSQAPNNGYATARQ